MLPQPQITSTVLHPSTGSQTAFWALFFGFVLQAHIDTTCFDHRTSLEFIQSLFFFFLRGLSCFCASIHIRIFSFRALPSQTNTALRAVQCRPGQARSISNQNQITDLEVIFRRIDPPHLCLCRVCPLGLGSKAGPGHGPWTLALGPGPWTWSQCSLPPIGGSTPSPISIPHAPRPHARSPSFLSSADRSPHASPTSGPGRVVAGPRESAWATGRPSTHPPPASLPACQQFTWFWSSILEI